MSKDLKIRIQPYVTAGVHQKLAAYCARRHLTESAVVDRALREHLDGLGDMTLLYQRLDRLNRSLQKLDRTQRIVGELCNQFIKAWFRNTPGLPEADNRVNEGPAKDRYRNLLARLTGAVTSGKTFFDALPEDDLAPDAPHVPAAATARHVPAISADSAEHSLEGRQNM